jgi:hypothetical protein
MNKETATALGGFTVAALLISACTTVVDEPDPDPTTSELTQQSTLSECGGFASPTDSGDSGDAPAYCDAEVLHWSYDGQTQELTLNNSRIELNCCGDHSMVINQEGDVYVVTETDAPEVYEGQTARCNCACVFDFALQAEGIGQEPIELEIRRHVTDESQAAQTVFAGTLDLSQQSGWEIIDTAPAMGCETESAPPQEEEPSAS